MKNWCASEVRSEGLEHLQISYLYCFRSGEVFQLGVCSTVLSWSIVAECRMPWPVFPAKCWSLVLSTSSLQSPSEFHLGSQWWWWPYCSKCRWWRLRGYLLNIKHDGDWKLELILLVPNADVQLLFHGILNDILKCQAASDSNGLMSANNGFHLILALWILQCTRETFTQSTFQPSWLG